MQVTKTITSFSFTARYLFVNKKCANFFFILMSVMTLLVMIMQKMVATIAMMIVTIEIVVMKVMVVMICRL